MRNDTSRVSAGSVVRIGSYRKVRHTWKEAVVEWANVAHQDMKPSTLERYLVSLAQVRPIMDGLYLDQITTRTISRIARRAGVTNATRHRDVTAVSAVFRWCVAHGWLERNPARLFDLSAVRERRDPIHLPDDRAIDALVATVPDNFARMVCLAQYTGLRLEEIAGLRRSQVLDGALQLTNTKSGTLRTVPLDERAAAALAGAIPFVGSPYVFWHHKGERYRNVSSRFRGYVKRSGVRPFRFNDLRHWYAVDYLRRGGSIDRLSQLLGHSNVKATRIYLRYFAPQEAKASKAGAFVARAADDKTEYQHRAQEELKRCEADERLLEDLSRCSDLPSFAVPIHKAAGGKIDWQGTARDMLAAIAELTNPADTAATGRFNRANRDTLDQMRQADRDAWGAVMHRLGHRDRELREQQ
jgi:integrase/recombinase XerD